MGQVNAVDSMNAIRTNVVGRGSRMAHGDNEEIAPSTTARFVRPLSLPTCPTKLAGLPRKSLLTLRSRSRSQRFASVETFAQHTLNDGSARFPGQNIPRSLTVQTLRTSAVIREPRPTSILLCVAFISFPAIPAFTAFHSGASPHQL